jgi:hypothetical protein
MSLFPSQIPHELAWDRTQASGAADRLRHYTAPTTVVFDKRTNHCALYEDPSILFPRLAYLTNVPIIVPVGRPEYTVPTTGRFGKYLYPYSGEFAKCLPGHCELVPTTRVLGHPTYLMILCVHTHGSLVYLSKVNESWGRKIRVSFAFSHIYRHLMGKRTVGKRLYKCIVPMT